MVSPRVGHRLLYLSTLSFFYLLITAIVSYVFLTIPGLNTWKDIGFEDMITSHTRKPFVMRVLMPTLIRVGSELVPLSFEQKLRTLVMTNTTLSDQMVRLGWNQDFIVEYAILIISVLACYLGFAVVLRSLLATLNDLPKGIIDYAPLMALLALISMFSTVNYIYDPMNLFLNTLALLCVLRQRMGLFSIVFIMATINKESALLLLIPAMIIQWKKRKNLLWEIGCLCCVWSAIRIFLLWLYRDYPGASFENHLMDNLNPFSYISIHFWKHYIFLSVLVALTISDWSYKPKELKNSLLGMIVVLIPLWIFFGRIPEIRIFYEAYPLALLLAIPQVSTFYNDEQIYTKGKN